MKIYLFSSAPSTEALAYLQSLIWHYVGNGSVSDQVQPVTKYTVRANLSPVQVFKIFYFTSAFCKFFSSPNPAIFLRAAPPKHQLNQEIAKNEISSNSPRMKFLGH